MRSIDNDHFGARGDGLAIIQIKFGKRSRERVTISPQFIEVDCPVVASRFFHIALGRVQRYVNRLTAVKGDGRKILIKKRLKHNDLISMLQECSENRVLACEFLK